MLDLVKSYENIVAFPTFVSALFDSSARQNQLDFKFLINLCKTVFRPGADLSLHFMPIANIEHLSVCTNIDKNYLFIKI